MSSAQDGSSTFAVADIVLIDDDSHSARLLMRALDASGAPTVHWLDGARKGLSYLRGKLDAAAGLPSMAIIDLKRSSSANLDLLDELSEVVARTGLRVVAVIRDNPNEREALYEAGASAVFNRHFEIDAYRREAMAMVRFWAQGQCPDAVGM